MNTQAKTRVPTEIGPGDGVDRGLGIWRWIERDDEWVWIPWDEASD